MATISIGGIDIPGVTSYKVELSDLDSENTTRSETGYMTRDVIRQGIAKISLSCRLTDTQVDTVASLLYPKSFSATFRAPTSTGYKTATMYAGNRSLSLVADTAPLLWDLSVNLIEY